jgi:hypothetical protein
MIAEETRKFYDPLSKADPPSVGYRSIMGSDEGLKDYLNMVVSNNSTYGERISIFHRQNGDSASLTIVQSIQKQHKISSNGYLIFE